MFDIHAVDNDKDLNGIITYEFDIVQGGSEDYKKFILDSATGNLALNETADREIQEVYIVSALPGLVQQYVPVSTIKCTLKASTLVAKANKYLYFQILWPLLLIFQYAK